MKNYSKPKKMNKMNNKHILVPIDFTDIAETGLVTAIDIAKQIDADINLLHIISDHGTLGFQTDGDLQASAKQASERDHFMMELIKKRKQQMNLLVGHYGSKDFTVNAFVEFGSFRNQLKKHLDENPTNLVVMGTTGETSISELLTGNHAAKAIRVANVPVLAVKEYYPVLTKDNLLILVDLKGYDVEKVGLIKQFADLMQMNVVIGHVKQLKDVIKGDIYQELQNFALDNNFYDSEIHIIGEGEKIEAIKDFISRYDINVIASITEGETGLTRMVFGSDTEDFLNEINRPIIAVSQ
jgi:nucleotide-binding universal stress UspA family protein